MKPRTAFAWAAAAAVLAVSLSFCLTRPRVTATAKPGPQATHYDVEFGPADGLREALIDRGTIPADAVDTGLGRFVSPDTLTAAERHAAAERVARRDAHRRPRHRVEER